MSPRCTLAVAGRVLRQLRRDPRTIAMVLVVPCVLMTLVKYMFEGQPGTFERIGPPMLGLFPLIMMFLITSITMLRERTTGTLERLMTMPLSKLDLLAGYGIAFALLAALQAAVTTAFAYGVLGLTTAGSGFWVAVLAIANAVLGMSLGLLVSAFARTEFQAVQFMPAFILPQILLCGLLVPRSEMADWLDTLAGALPFTYAYDALARVSAGDSFSGHAGPRRRRGDRGDAARAGARRGDAATAHGVTGFVDRPARLDRACKSRWPAGPDPGSFHRSGSVPARVQKTNLRVIRGRGVRSRPAPSPSRAARSARRRAGPVRRRGPGRGRRWRSRPRRTGAAGS